MVRSVLAAALVAAATSCYPQPAIDACRVQCGSAGACPAGTECGADGFCHSPAQLGTSCTGIADAGTDGPGGSDVDATVFEDAGVVGALAVRAIGFGSSSDDQILGLAVGPSGVVAGGSFEGTMTVPGLSMASPAGIRDGFTLTLDADLAADQLRTLGGSGVTTAVNDVAVTGGRILVTGAADGTISFGLANDSCEYFVAEYETMTSADWHHCVGTVSSGGGVAAATGGVTVTTGLFAGTADFGAPGMRTSVGMFDAMVVDYSSAGAPQSVQVYPGADPSHQGRGEAIEVDGAGNRYLTGFFLGELDAGGTSNLTTLAAASFVGSYEANASYRWAVAFSEPAGTSAANDLALGTASDLFVTGTMSGDVSFGDATRNGRGFVVRLRADDGTTIWSRDMDVSGTVLVPNALAVGASGDIYLAGTFRGTLSLAGETREAQGSTAVFVAKLSQSGDLRWLRAFDSSGDDAAHGIAVATSGRIYVAGYYGAAIDFDGQALTHQGGADAFIVELTE